MNQKTAGDEVGPASATRYVGARIQRVEDARLVRGRGTFVDDVTRPGLVHATFVRSPHARALIERIDVTAALDMAGVHAVLLADDLNPDLRELWYSTMGKRAPSAPLPPLAQGEVRFVGDPVALVIADDRYLAEDAAEQVLVDYEPLRAVADYSTADENDALVHEEYPGNLVGEMAGGSAEAVDAALAQAAHVVESTIHQQAYTAAPMETRGVVVEWDGSAETLTVWAATQAPHEFRSVCSRVLGVAENRIRVIMGDTGGGFGQKVVPLREEVCLALAARRFPAPIKWVEGRRENLLSGGQARHEHGTTRIGLDEDGLIVAATLAHTQDVGAYPIPWPVGTGAAVGMIFPGPYRIPTTGFSHRSMFSNTQGRTAYRGPWQFESVAREVALDVAARQLGVDPVELRRRNLLGIDDLPYTNGSGMPYSDISPRETFEHALELFDYEGFRGQQDVERAAGRYLGVGTCSYVEPTTPGNGFYASEGASIRIDPSGKVSVHVAGGSAGNSLETTVAQLAADALGVPIDDVLVVQGDTALTPYGAGTAGSRSGSMTAGAVEATAAVLRDKLRAIAAHRLECSADDIELENGQASVRGTPAASLQLSQLAEIAYHKTHALPPGTSAGLEATERHTTSPFGLFANATHVCSCEVDVETGRVEILRYVVSEDCGPMINPEVVEGQIAGGTAQGIGGALFEELAYDASGTPLATTFMDYLIPSAAEIPPIEFGHVETMAAGPGGYKGVGEGGAIGAPPAVINAVADALAPFGVRIDRLPLSPQAIVSLIGAV